MIFHVSGTYSSPGYSIPVHNVVYLKWECGEYASRDTPCKVHLTNGHIIGISWEDGRKLERLLEDIAKDALCTKSS